MKKLLIYLTLALTLVTFSSPAWAADLDPFETIIVDSNNGFDSNQFQDIVTTKPGNHGLVSTGTANQGLIFSGIGDSSTKVSFEGNFAQYRPFSVDRSTNLVDINHSGSSYERIYANAASGENYSSIDGAISNNSVFDISNVATANSMTSAMGGTQCMSAAITGESVGFAGINQQVLNYSIERPDNGGYQAGSAVTTIEHGSFPVTP